MYSFLMPVFLHKTWQYCKSDKTQMSATACALPTSPSAHAPDLQGTTRQEQQMIQGRQITSHLPTTKYCCQERLHVQCLRRGLVKNLMVIKKYTHSRLKLERALISMSKASSSEVPRLILQIDSNNKRFGRFVMCTQPLHRLLGCV